MGSVARAPRNQSCALISKLCMVAIHSRSECVAINWPRRSSKGEPYIMQTTSFYWVTAAAVALVATGAPRVAAANVKKQAIAASVLAKAAHQRGQFAEAAKLYRQAYALDPTTFGYLYSSARCEQKAGNSDAARELYTKFLASGGEKTRFASKAKTYLLELRAANSKEMAAKLASADRARVAAEAKLAAEMKRSSQSAASTPPGGRTGVSDTPNHGGAPPAASASPGSAQTAAGSAVPSVVTRPQPPGANRWIGWSVLAGGVAVLGGGTIWWLMREADSTALLAELNDKPQSLSTADIARIDRDNAATKSDKKVATALIATGAVGAVIGAVLTMRTGEPVKTALIPNGSGLVFVHHF